MEDYTKFLNASDPAIDSAIEALGKKDVPTTNKTAKNKKIAAVTPAMNLQYRQASIHVAKLC